MHADAHYIIKKQCEETNHHARTCIALSYSISKPKNKWNIGDLIATRYMNYMSTDIFLDSMISGYFKINIPFVIDINHYHPQLKNTLDLVGMNYYTTFRCMFNPLYKTFSNKNIELTERVDSPIIIQADPKLDKHLDDIAIDPSGFYEALLRCHERYKKDIIITENGLALDTNTKNDDVRVKFIKTHLHALNHAIRDGVKIHSYHLWTLVDTFEWFGMRQIWKRHYGIYGVDRSKKNSKRFKKKSAIVYKNIINQK